VSNKFVLVTSVVKVVVLIVEDWAKEANEVSINKLLERLGVPNK